MLYFVSSAAAKRLETSEQRHAFFVQGIQARESVAGAQEIYLRMSGRGPEAEALLAESRALGSGGSPAAEKAGEPPRAVGPLKDR